MKMEGRAEKKAEEPKKRTKKLPECVYKKKCARKSVQERECSKKVCRKKCVHSVIASLVLKPFSFQEEF